MSAQTSTVEWLGRSATDRPVTTHQLERMASDTFHASCVARVERLTVGWELRVDVCQTCVLTFSALTKRGVMADAHDLLRRMTVEP